MSSQNNLEITGNLREHQLPELLIEIFQAKLNGSLRLLECGENNVAAVKINNRFLRRIREPQRAVQFCLENFNQ